MTMNHFCSSVSTNELEHYTLLFYFQKSNEEIRIHVNAPKAIFNDETITLLVVWQHHLSVASEESDRKSGLST